MISRFFKGIAVFTLVTVFSTANAQIDVTFGTGLSTNTGTTYPAPYGNWYWGAKHQILILASEMTTQGMTAGDINSLAFNVATPNGTPLTDFTIGVKHTSTSGLAAFESGFTTVYGPQTHTETSGWNVHTFASPFNWDGVSNLLVEVCFNNTAFSQNATTYFTTTSFSSVVYYFGDNPTACTVQPFTQASNDRPDVRLNWTVPNAPPIANFSASPISTCSGVVSFTDLSTFNPTGWQWDFGDASPIDNNQHPTHTYTSSGTYTVTLTATNAFGNDIHTIPNYINVNLSGGTPIPASCTPATLNGTLGFGITNVTFNTINNTSSNSSEGYADFTCQQTTVLAGQSYTLSVTNDVPTTHNTAAWIDYNNDGILDNATELVFSASSALTPSGTVNIPATAVLNTPLRMRISADYDFSAFPTPCSDSDFGQAEDYTIIVSPNTSPPVADFTVDNTVTCDGTVCFTDISQNIPTGWGWDFGDATSTVAQHPCHTYTASGTYTVQLIAYNTNGNDTITYPNLITVNLGTQPVAPSCTPATLGYCCNYGIYNVTLGSINHSTVDASEGYQDFSCTQVTHVMEGTVEPISVRTGPDNSQDTRVWIDYNNDGVFDNATELAFSSNNTFDPTGNIVVPTQATAVLSTPLRMRVSSDVVGATLLPCSDNTFGQTEDYTVIIDTLSFPPTANFVADVTYTCDGIVNFTDLSTNAPIGWQWDFGDASPIDNNQHPSHTYTSNGTYTVSLTVTNSSGNDNMTIVNYIVVDTNGICDTTLVPTTGTDIVTECNGLLMDDGGLGFYSNNTDGAVSIQPNNAAQITLTFTFFNLVSSFGGDTIFVYDGPTTASPLLGAFSGNNMPNGNGIVTSTGGSMTVRQLSDANTTDPGFEAEWNCSYGNGLVETPENSSMLIYPNPASNNIIVEFDQSRNKVLEISISNLVGQSILKEQVNTVNDKFQQNIDVTNYSRGVYLVTVRTENGLYTSKITLQ
jgi:PKD repeat protein